MTNEELMWHGIHITARNIASVWLELDHLYSVTLTSLLVVSQRPNLVASVQAAYQNGYGRDSGDDNFINQVYRSYLRLLKTTFFAIFYCIHCDI